MIWRDIILDKNINKKELIKAFSLVFGLGRDRINSIDDITEFGDNYLFTFITYWLQGNFCLQLDCYPDFKIEDEFRVISHLCKILDCQALITNDKGEDVYNPWAFILFKPSGEVNKVYVDDELLDKYNELKIIREIPYL